MKISTVDEGKMYIEKIFTEHGVRDLYTWLEQTDFFTAPASTQYHGAEPFGLVNHSIAVFHAFNECTSQLCDRNVLINQEWIDDAIVATLCHDVCKIGLYRPVEKWRKNKNGKWETYPGYEINKDLVQIGHGVESLRIIEQHYKFNNEGWAQAVSWHMGTPDSWVDKQQYYKAVEKHPEVLALHTADVYASFIMKY